MKLNCFIAVFRLASVYTNRTKISTNSPFFSNGFRNRVASRAGLGLKVDEISGLTDLIGALYFR